MGGRGASTIVSVDGASPITRALRMHDVADYLVGFPNPPISVGGGSFQRGMLRIVGPMRGT